MQQNYNGIEKIKLFSQYEKLFSCPMCTRPMQLVHSKSLICQNNHCFDLAKRGYVHLLPRPHDTKYSKALFEARQILHDAGYWDPLVEQVKESISSRLRSQHAMLTILDAGCGEGSQLSAIQHMLAEQLKIQSLGVGIDLSKEGIQLAARKTSRTIWCVADLANCPLADKQFDVILNILSPSNYTEFKRLIADGGILIKVIPGNGHLHELRNLLDKPANYSNEETEALFKQHFQLIDKQEIHYRSALDQALLPHLLEMSPLSWDASETRIKDAANQELTEITFHFDILIGTIAR